MKPFHLDFFVQEIIVCFCLKEKPIVRNDIRCQITPFNMLTSTFDTRLLLINASDKTYGPVIRQIGGIQYLGNESNKESCAQVDIEP